MSDDDAPTPRKPGPTSSLGAFQAGFGVAGQYRLIQKVGGGAQGHVWSADDVIEGGKRALKFSLSLDNSDLQREASIGASIRDPNVCEIYGGVRAHDDVSFIVMEYITGDNLAEYLTAIGRFTPGVAARIVNQIASGLDAIHSEDFVHRDIKPKNVMLTKTGVVKISDLGLTVYAKHARIVGAGTTEYMAPELLAFASPATKQSDVYAAGLVLYELLTGARCHGGATWDAIAESIARHQPPSATTPGIPPRLDEIVMWCLSDDPGGRPSSRELAKACAEQM